MVCLFQLFFSLSIVLSRYIVNDQFSTLDTCSLRFTHHCTSSHPCTSWPYRLYSPSSSSVLRLHLWIHFFITPCRTFQIWTTMSPSPSHCILTCSGIALDRILPSSPAVAAAVVMMRTLRADFANKFTAPSTFFLSPARHWDVCSTWCSPVEWQAATPFQFHSPAGPGTGSRAPDKYDAVARACWSIGQEQDDVDSQSPTWEMKKSVTAKVFLNETSSGKTANELMCLFSPQWTP